MVRFAVQKKFHKQNRSSATGPRFEILKRFLVWMRSVSLVFLWIFLGIVVVVYGVYISLQKTIFAPENRIGGIDYTVSSVRVYDNPYLYKLISTQIKKENYNVVKWNMNEILSKVQKDFPFVKEIIMGPIKERKVVIKVLFDDILFLLKNQEKRYAVYNENVVELFSGDSLGSGSMIVELPLYASGVNALTGLFFQFKAKELYDHYMVIKESLSDLVKIVYLVGGGRSAVIMPHGKTLYFNHNIDLKQQIDAFENVRKYYGNYMSIKEIDLGSLESDKVIIKMY